MAVEVVEIVEGDGAGRRFAMDQEALIGRTAESDVRLDDPRVSRRHAVLRVADGRLTVEDLGSTGGTRLNGAPIAGPTPLTVGDRVGVGGTELEVLWAPEAATLAGEVPPEPARTMAGEAPAPPPAPAPAPAGAPAPPGGSRALWIVASLLGVLGAAGGLAAVFLDFVLETSLWAADEADIRAQAIMVPGIALAFALGLLVAVLTDAPVRLRDVEAGVLALAGAAIAGPAIVVVVGEFDDLKIAVWVLLGSAALAAAGGVMGLVAAGRERAPARRPVVRMLPGLAVADGAAILAAIAGVLDVARVDIVDQTYAGLTGDLPVGRALLGLGVLCALATMTTLILVVVRARPGPGIVPALVLAGALLGTALGIVTLLSSAEIDLLAGPVLGLIGGALAAAGVLAAALGLALRPETARPG